MRLLFWVTALAVLSISWAKNATTKTKPKRQLENIRTPQNLQYSLVLPHSRVAHFRSLTNNRRISNGTPKGKLPPYAVQMEPVVQYSQKDPLYDPNHENVDDLVVNKNEIYAQSKILNVQDQSAESSFGPPYGSLPTAPLYSQEPHRQYYDSPEPIIEIIIKESNESLPAPPPTPVQKKKKEPVHVFYVKYSKDPNSKDKVIYEKPIPAITPPSNEEDDHHEEYVTVTPEPVYAPPKTTTLRAIIKPESEIYHSDSSVKITFGNEGRHYTNKHHRDSLVEDREETAPKPAIVLPNQPLPQNHHSLDRSATLQPQHIESVTRPTDYYSTPSPHTYKAGQAHQAQSRIQFHQQYFPTEQQLPKQGPSSSSFRSQSHVSRQPFGTAPSLIPNPAFSNGPTGPIFSNPTVSSPVGPAFPTTYHKTNPSFQSRPNAPIPFGTRTHFNGPPRASFHSGPQRPFTFSQPQAKPYFDEAKYLQENYHTITTEQIDPPKDQLPPNRQSQAFNNLQQPSPSPTSAHFQDHHRRPPPVSLNQQLPHQKPAKQFAEPSHNKPVLSVSPSSSPFFNLKPSPPQIEDNRPPFHQQSQQQFNFHQGIQSSPRPLVQLSAQQSFSNAVSPSPSALPPNQFLPQPSSPTLYNFQPQPSAIPEQHRYHQHSSASEKPFIQQSHSPSEIPFQQFHGPSERPFQQSHGPSERPFQQSHGPSERPFQQSHGPSERPFQQSHGPSERPFQQSHGPSERPFQQTLGPSERPFQQSHRPSESSFQQFQSHSEKPFQQSHGPSERPFQQQHGPTERPFLQSQNPSERPPFNQQNSFQGQSNLHQQNIGQFVPNGGELVPAISKYEQHFTVNSLGDSNPSPTPNQLEQQYHQVPQQSQYLDPEQEQVRLKLAQNVQKQQEEIQRLQTQLLLNQQHQQIYESNHKQTYNDYNQQVQATSPRSQYIQERSKVQSTNAPSTSSPPYYQSTSRTVDIKPTTQKYVSSTINTINIASETKKEEKKKKTTIELPDEVPDDLRQQLLSSGILDNADISVLDYDKVGETPLESLPPDQLANFFSAGGGQQIAASENRPIFIKPNGARIESRIDEDIMEEDQEGAASENVPSFVAPPAEQKQAVEMKVVHFDPETPEGQNIAKAYVNENATQVDPVTLNDKKYNRYLPLKVSGNQFPLPDILKGKKITSVVVLAPVETEILNSEHTRKVREANNNLKGIKFVAGDSLQDLLKHPTKDNFEKWLNIEKKTASDLQSIVLLVTGQNTTSEDREIYMYDIGSGTVNKLSGELSNAFIEAAENNSLTKDIESLAIEGDGTPENFSKDSNDEVVAEGSDNVPLFVDLSGFSVDQGNSNRVAISSGYSKTKHGRALRRHS